MRTIWRDATGDRGTIAKGVSEKEVDSDPEQQITEEDGFVDAICESVNAE